MKEKIVKIKMIKEATLEDIKKELESRGVLVETKVHTDQYGNRHPLSEMSNKYLLNTFRWFQRTSEEDLLDEIGIVDPNDCL
jgi:hypothetical protein